MYQHHIESIEKMKAYFADTPGIIALVLGRLCGQGE